VWLPECGVILSIICDLEDDLIPPVKWQKLYAEMPKKCQEVVEGSDECIGIGKNSKLGWFIRFWSRSGFIMVRT
jgi:hypothetical protein